MGGSGIFTVSSDQGVLHTEPLKNTSFNVGVPLSNLYPFAVSDKKITVTLGADSGEVTLACAGGWAEWSGINVIPPERYAVERWYLRSYYDQLTEGGDTEGYYLILISIKIRHLRRSFSRHAASAALGAVKKVS